MPDGNNYGSDSISEMLAERGKTHGDFTDHARITTDLKYVMSGEILARDRRGQPRPSDEAMEALSMIAHKIGRILAGRWDHPDHWDDIAGYAKLVSERLVTGTSAPAPADSPCAFKGVKVAWGHEDPGDTGA